MAEKTLQGDGWRGIAGFVHYRHKNGFQLTVALSQEDPDVRDVNGRWIVLALEVPPSKGKKNKGEHVLNNLAHKYLGTFPLTQAIVEAEQYAARWEPGQALCECDEVAPKATRRSRRPSHLPSSTRN